MLIAAWRQRRGLWQRRARFLVALAAWSAAYGAFAFYWTPGDFTFWMPILAAWWLLAALLAQAGSAGWRWLAAAGVAALLILNFALAIRPQLELGSNRYYQAALSFQGNVSYKDLALVSGDEMLILYLRYFAGLRALTLPRLPPPENALPAYATWAQRLADLQQQGGRTYIIAPAFQPASALEQEIRRLYPAFESVTLRLAWESAGWQVWEWQP
jgi:hypothetical protein